MRYLIREKMISFGDDYVVKNEAGEPVFLFDGAAFTILRERFAIKDMQGHELGFIRRKLISLRTAYEIHLGGKHVATVSKDLLTVFRCSFTVDVPGPDDYEAQGNLLDREYTFRRHGKVVAEVSKKWFSLTDTYAVDVSDEADAVLILASAAVIDQVCHEEHATPKSAVT